MGRAKGQSPCLVAYLHLRHMLKNFEQLETLFSPPPPDSPPPPASLVPLPTASLVLSPAQVIAAWLAGWQLLLSIKLQLSILYSERRRKRAGGVRERRVH